VLALWTGSRSTPTVIVMANPRTIKPTPASLAELWREIAVYLEIWELIRHRLPDTLPAGALARRAR
jgi:hypothetical protein